MNFYLELQSIKSINLIILDLMIGAFTTNKILRLSRGQKELTYYLPAYFRLNLKNIIGIELHQLSGTINCTLLLTINYKGLPSQHFSTLRDSVIITFSKDTSIHLKPSVQCNVKDNKNYTLTFVVRTNITLAMNPKISWSPFQYIQLILNATIQPIYFQSQNKSVIIKFNLMDHNNNFLKLSYSEDRHFGYYTLAQAKMKVVYNNILQADQLRVLNQNTHSIMSKILDFAYEKLQQKQQDEKIESFQNAHFTIPVYKHPGTTLFTVFVPLWMLAFLNIGVFFQQDTLGKRFLNIAALMISYVALIPSIRSTIPPSKHIVFTQYLVYIQSSLTIICLLQSISERNDDMIDEMYTKHWSSRPFLILSILITSFTIASVVVMFLVHRFIWQPSYHLKQSEKITQKFDHQNWRNEACDQYFQNRLYKNQRSRLIQLQ